MENKDTRLVVLIPQSLKTYLENEAENRGQASLGSVVREALEDWRRKQDKLKEQSHD